MRQGATPGALWPEGRPPKKQSAVLLLGISTSFITLRTREGKRFRPALPAPPDQGRRLCPVGSGRCVPGPASWSGRLARPEPGAARGDARTFTASGS
ncbi:hypothetical protein DVDV_0444 [Desulfovibrio sp. DV]|nr:hypothetical protein DVDV_0444 [Desulfovibrio sp. DV]